MTRAASLTSVLSPPSYSLDTSIAYTEQLRDATQRNDSDSVVQVFKARVMLGFFMHFVQTGVTGFGGGA